ncbi:MAG: precorrin-6y C5,15-methyltransferase (decarboxylating) subunit CbiE [Bacteroides sp.]|nr:precorrin-6y C5,15-methyltransferase (decarboxylating) subunit CbiE [Bacteroides sp.]
MCKPRQFTVIGISDSHRQEMISEVRDIIASSHVFSGGRRHHEIMEPYLPDDHLWIDVTVPLSEVYVKYGQYDNIVVFASGDPLFYGFGATLQREFPDAEIKVYPSFNSLQMLAHRLNLPYQDMISTSVTGRPWKGLDDALISDHTLIGVLTDHRKGPAEIASRMLEYGYYNYTMSIGVALGNDKDERIYTYIPLHKVKGESYPGPNCVLLHRMGPRPRRFGIPEQEFHHLDGRDKMITKMPIRLLSLSMLDLYARHTLWDVGYCTGSVSIEARLQFPHLDIIAFEKRPECDRLLDLNSIRHGAPDIIGVTGDFFEADLTAYPAPDAVFIGGHGGRLTEMLAKLDRVLRPGGVIVFNSVSDDSCREFEEAVHTLNRNITERHRITLDSHNPITILKAQ